MGQSRLRAEDTRLRELRTAGDRRSFLLNLICFAACIEGLFFYGAFAYVYFLRSRGLLNGLASGTNWVFRDESMHMAFAFDVVGVVRAEEPALFDAELTSQVREMLAEAVECEAQFAEDLLEHGVSGMSLADLRAPGNGARGTLAPHDGAGGTRTPLEARGRSGRWLTGPAGRGGGHTRPTWDA